MVKLSYCSRQLVVIYTYSDILHKCSVHNTIFGKIEILHAWSSGKPKTIILQCVKQSFCLSNKASSSDF